MSVAGAAISAEVPSVKSTDATWLAKSDALERVARGGVIALVLLCPFEALRPLLRIPGQSFSTVEAALLCVFAACAGVVVVARRWPRVALADALPWAALVCAAIVSASVAPAFKSNAVHMAVRLAIAAVVWGITVVGARSEAGRTRVAFAALVSGTFISALVIADFAGVPVVSHALRYFRTGVAVVGAQVRASGPFQYPTIAAMYLEMAFALGLGLLAASTDRPRVQKALVLALAVVAEALILTFTRAALITMALSLLLVAGLVWRGGGFNRAVVSIGLLTVLIAAELLSSRSAEMLVLRMTTEGQGRWFSAVIRTPSRVTLDSRQPIRVPLTITNTGRATWDSNAAEPIRLSYHWIAEDSDEVIAWEGTRTLFNEPVRPGQTVSVAANLGGPGRPGRFRLMWDLEQKGRLWFSTEPDAVPVFAEGTVTGPVVSMQNYRGPMSIPRTEVRPGRLVLWSAAMRMWSERPLFGVGPDNFRLLYGRYATLRTADPRIHSNNMYVEVLAGTGLVGFASFLWLGLRSARAMLHAARTHALGYGIAAACLACAVHGLVDSFLSFTGTYILIAVVFGLASASTQDDEGHAHRV
ncbi:MAG: O-antigen ligase family protein [Vicinamibacterales bacterium]